MILSHRCDRKNPSINRPDADGIEADPVVLVEEVRIAQDVRIDASDPCRFALFRAVETCRLIRGQIESGQEFQKGASLSLLVADVAPGVANHRREAVE